MVQRFTGVVAAHGIDIAVLGVSQQVGDHLGGYPRLSQAQGKGTAQAFEAIVVGGAQFAALFQIAEHVAFAHEEARCFAGITVHGGVAELRKEPGAFSIILLATQELDEVEKAHLNECLRHG